MREKKRAVGALWLDEPPGAHSEVELLLYFDGASANPGPSSAGFVVKEAAGRLLYEGSDYIGDATNNVAELAALLRALRWLEAHGQGKRALIHGDSRLAVNLAAGRWKVRAAHLKPLVDETRRLMARVNADLQWIPRERNGHADLVAARALEHGRP